MTQTQITDPGSADSGAVRDVDVVVIGGGIGGLANAYALVNRGHAVRVLERAPKFAEVGAGLQIAPNATRILGEWGLLDEVVELGVTPRRLVLKDAVDGSELTHLDLNQVFTQRYGAPYVVIHRNDLHNVLYRACLRAGVELVPDTEVVDVQCSDGSAVVHTRSAQHRGEVAVAADGLRSGLRAKVSDDEPVCSGYVAYRGAFEVSQLTVDLDEDALSDVVVYLGARCHLVQYPLRRGEMFNTVAVFESPAFHRGESDWGGPDELDAAFAGSCPEVRRGLASLWRDRRWPMYDRLPIANWVDDRLVLSGDAAHPMLQYLAQGACQAIEDAQCLAAEAGRTASGGDTDWPRVLASYQKVRTERTARVQSSARFWGDLWHVDGLARLIRNELFRERRPNDFKHIDWLYHP